MPQLKDVLQTAGEVDSIIIGKDSIIEGNQQYIQASTPEYENLHMIIGPEGIVTGRKMPDQHWSWKDTNGLDIAVTTTDQEILSLTTDQDLLTSDSTYQFSGKLNNTRTFQGDITFTFSMLIDGIVTDTRTVFRSRGDSAAFVLNGPLTADITAGQSITVNASADSDGGNLLGTEVVTTIEMSKAQAGNIVSTTTVAADLTVTKDSLTGVIAEAITNDLTITLPLLSTLDNSYKIMEVYPKIANGFKVRIQCQGTDTFPFGNTWFDLPASQQQFSIGMHPSLGFNIRRNISVSSSVTLNIPWDAANFTTPTGIPWDTLESENQPEIIASDVGGLNPERITVNTSGEYTIRGGLSLDSTGGVTWNATAQIYKNGVAVPHMLMKTGNYGSEDQSIFAEMPIQLLAGDYVELRVSQSNLTGNISSASFNVSIRL